VRARPFSDEAGTASSAVLACWRCSSGEAWSPCAEAEVGAALDALGSDVVGWVVGCVLGGWAVGGSAAGCGVG
jgi:hypothetical protein